MDSTEATREERRRKGLRVGALILAGALVLSLFLAGGFAAYVWQARQPVSVGGYTLMGPNCEAGMLLTLVSGQNRQVELVLWKGAGSGKFLWRIQAKPAFRAIATGPDRLVWAGTGPGPGYRVVKGSRLWRWAGFTIIAP